MTSVANHATPLRRALLVDAAASGTMGLVMLLAASPLESLFGLPTSLLRPVGLFLIPFAAFLVWLAQRADSLRGLVRAVVVGNILWVLASVLLLVSGLVTPTAIGTLFVLAQAAAVVVFAALEYRALLAIVRFPSPATYGG